MTFETEQLGKVAAEFDVTAKGISGMVVYEKKTGKEMLEGLEQTIKDGLSGENTKRVSIGLVQSNSLDLGRFGQDRQPRGTDNGVSTAELYQTAKAFLTAFR